MPEELNQVLNVYVPEWKPLSDAGPGQGYKIPRYSFSAEAFKSSKGDVSQQVNAYSIEPQDFDTTHCTKSVQISKVSLGVKDALSLTESSLVQNASSYNVHANDLVRAEVAATKASISSGGISVASDTTHAKISDDVFWKYDSATGFQRNVDATRKVSKDKKTEAFSSIDLTTPSFALGELSMLSVDASEAKLKQKGNTAESFTKEITINSQVTDMSHHNEFKCSVGTDGLTGNGQRISLADENQILMDCTLDVDCSDSAIAFNTDDLKLMKDSLSLASASGSCSASDSISMQATNSFVANTHNENVYLSNKSGDGENRAQFDSIAYSIKTSEQEKIALESTRENLDANGVQVVDGNGTYVGDITGALTIASGNISHESSKLSSIAANECSSFVPLLTVAADPVAGDAFSVTTGATSNVTASVASSTIQNQSNKGITSGAEKISINSDLSMNIKDNNMASVSSTTVELLCNTSKTTLTNSASTITSADIDITATGNSTVKTSQSHTTSVDIVPDALDPSNSQNLLSMSRTKLSFGDEKEIEFWRRDSGRKTVNECLRDAKRGIDSVRRLIGGDRYLLNNPTSQSWLSSFSDKMKDRLDLTRAHTFKDGDARLALQVNELYKRLEFFNMGPKDHAEGISEIATNFGRLMTIEDPTMSNVASLGQDLQAIKDIRDSLQRETDLLFEEETQYTQDPSAVTITPEYIVYAQPVDSVVEQVFATQSTETDYVGEIINGVQHWKTFAHKIWFDSSGTLRQASGSDILLMIHEYIGVSASSNGHKLPVIFDDNGTATVGYLYNKKLYANPLPYSDANPDSQILLKDEEWKQEDAWDESKKLTVRYHRFQDAPATAKTTLAVTRDSTDALSLRLAHYNITGNAIEVYNMIFDPTLESFESTEIMYNARAARPDASGGSYLYTFMQDDTFGLDDSGTSADQLQAFPVQSFNLNENGYLYASSETPVSVAYRNNSTQMISGDANKILVLPSFIAQTRIKFASTGDIPVPNGVPSIQFTEFKQGTVDEEYIMVDIPKVTDSSSKHTEVKLVKEDEGIYNIDTSEVSYHRLREYFQKGSFFDNYTHIGKVQPLFPDPHTFTVNSTIATGGVWTFDISGNAPSMPGPYSKLYLSTTGFNNSYNEFVLIKNYQEIDEGELAGKDVSFEFVNPDDSTALTNITHFYFSLR